MPEFHRLTVLDHVREAEDAVRLRLALPSSARAAFRGLPGQHVTIRATVDGRALRRTYSLVSEPGSEHLEIAFRVHPQGRVSRLLAREAQPGATLEVLPPSGRFCIAPPAADVPADYLALAAGSGVTPVFALVRDLLGRSPRTRCTVCIGNRCLARAMLVEDWLALKDRYLERLALQFVMSREPQEITWLNGRLDRPWLERLAPELCDPTQLEAALLCGPGGMIAELTGALESLGVPPERIHGEHFALERRAPGAAAAAAAGMSQPAATTGMTEVTVVVDGRRRGFSMPRGGEVVLAAAEAAGLELPYSCRSGICSTCRVKVLEGEVEMGEQYALEPWELAAGFTLACQARPRSERLTLTYDER
ncbi:MAG TPA: 2Fe-2S iron-sulfur cluster-binding protein [Steroidobacteraceae bacterium]|nr:2Fe-2S iron-sulfur cluster-binding protein [Steroidobacteraceae bacterium]